MEKKTALAFSNDGVEVRIVFADGKESDYFSTKNEAFAAFKVLKSTKRITAEEAEQFTAEVKEAVNLPSSDEDGEHTIHIGILGGGSLLGALIMGSILGDIMDTDSVEEPVFKMCKCGSSHGSIFIKQGRTGPFSSKAEGYEYIELMKKRNDLNDEQAEKVRQQIAESALPETREEK